MFIHKNTKFFKKTAVLLTAGLLSVSLAFASGTDKIELGAKVYNVNNQVLVEEVAATEGFYVEAGKKYHYNYNSLAKNNYKHNLEAAKEAFVYINQIRAGKGLTPFEWDEAMLRSATIRSMEIGEKWAHKRPDGTSFATSSNLIRSECLGKTSGSNPKTIVHAWLNSKAGHREALLTTKYKKAYISCVVAESGDLTNLYALHQR